MVQVSNPLLSLVGAQAVSAERQQGVQNRQTDRQITQRDVGIQQRQQQIDAQQQQFGTSSDQAQQQIDLRKVRQDFDIANAETKRQSISEAHGAFNARELLKIGNLDKFNEFIDNRIAGLDPEKAGDSRQIKELVNSGNVEEAMKRLDVVVRGAEAIGILDKDGESLQAPASVREFEFFEKLGEAEKRKFLDLKRSTKTVDLGGEIGVLNPVTGTVDLISKTLAPSDLPETKGAQQAAVREAALQADLKAAFPAEASAFERSAAKNLFMLETIKKIEPQISSATTGYSGLLKALPSSPQGKLRADIDTLIANAGFQELEELKQAGGTLGALSDTELRLLQALKGNILQSLNANDLRDNMDIFKRQVTLSQDRLKRGFERKFAESKSVDATSVTGQSAQPISAEDFFK